MNKKLISAVMAAAMLTSLTACGGEGSTPAVTTSAPAAATSAPAATTAAQAETTAAQADTTAAAQAAAPAGAVKYSYTANGTEIAINADADAVKAALGEPQQTFEAPSCAFDGTSYTYTYAGFTVETYPDPADKKNKVYAVTLKDASVQTAEGCKVGDSADDVKKACGEPTGETMGYLEYKGEGVALQFFLEEDKVTSVVYTYSK